MQFDSRSIENAERTCILDCKYISTLAFSMEQVRDQVPVVSRQSSAFSMGPMRD
jgi:hypothetical protein